MKLHYLQHVPFEGIGQIQAWAEAQQAEVSATRLYAGEPLPALDQFDLLIVMGGPMGIFDEKEFPYLAAEKAFIRNAIEAEKKVLGICLGAQLMAEALGATVYPGPQKEIGWLPITRAPEAPPLLPEALTVFHWHGDTFDLPAGALRLASSEGCINQAFLFKNHALGLQFHIETTPTSRAALIEHCRHELVAAPFIQSEKEILKTNQYFPLIHNALTHLLDEFVHGNPRLTPTLDA